jgi:hypothetical protein
MVRWLAWTLSALVVLLPSVAPAAPDPICVTEERVYREGVFMLVDALAENCTGEFIAGVEVTVVFLDFFDQLVRVEHTVLRPLSLAPGQVAALRVAVPFSDKFRKLEYRFTWRRQDGAQVQSRVRRDIWLGSTVR